MSVATKKPAGLAGLSKLATKKPAKTTKEVRPTWTFENDPNFETNLGIFLRIHTIAGEMDGVKTARESSIKDAFLTRWVADMWNTGVQPENPRVNIPLIDTNGSRSAIVDAECLFEVCKNARGLNEFANTDNLEEDQTPEEAIMKALMSPLVGLSQDNAMRFVHPSNGEVTVADCYNLASSIENLMASESESVRVAAMKLVAWFQGSKDTLKEEETAELLVSTKVVVIKDGFFARAKGYCENQQQLQKLIRFVKPKLVVKSVRFSDHDKKRRNAKLAETLSQFLAVE